MIWPSLHTKSYLTCANKEPTCWGAMAMLYFRQAGVSTHLQGCSLGRGNIRKHHQVGFVCETNKVALILCVCTLGTKWKDITLRGKLLVLGRYRLHLAIRAPDLSRRRCRRETSKSEAGLPLWEEIGNGWGVRFRRLHPWNNKNLTRAGKGSASNRTWQIFLKGSSGDPGWGMSKRASVPNNTSEILQTLHERIRQTVIWVLCCSSTVTSQDWKKTWNSDTCIHSAAQPVPVGVGNFLE